jgi:hypothetical protein
MMAHADHVLGELGLALDAVGAPTAICGRRSVAADVPAPWHSDCSEAD